jgi:hypothetical protein
MKMRKEIYAYNNALELTKGQRYEKNEWGILFWLIKKKYNFIF